MLQEFFGVTVGSRGKPEEEGTLLILWLRQRIALDCALRDIILHSEMREDGVYEFSARHTRYMPRSSQFAGSRFWLMVTFNQDNKLPAKISYDELPIGTTSTPLLQISLHYRARTISERSSKMAQAWYRDSYVVWKEVSTYKSNKAPNHRYDTVHH